MNKKKELNQKTEKSPYEPAASIYFNKFQVKRVYMNKQ